MLVIIIEFPSYRLYARSRLGNPFELTWQRRAVLGQTAYLTPHDKRTFKMEWVENLTVLQYMGPVLGGSF